jgi:hypothetical protein
VTSLVFGPEKEPVLQNSSSARVLAAYVGLCGVLLLTDSSDTAATLCCVRYVQWLQVYTAIAIEYYSAAPAAAASQDSV